MIRAGELVDHIERLFSMAVPVGILASSACSPRETVFDGFGDDARKLRVVNREVTRLQDPPARSPRQEEVRIVKLRIGLRPLMNCSIAAS